jgi:hypothetical protein
MLNIGDKIFDLEENNWGLVWRVNRESRRYHVRWSNGTLQRGLHECVINLEGGYELEHG